MRENKTAGERMSYSTFLTICEIDDEEELLKRIDEACEAITQLGDIQLAGGYWNHTMDNYVTFPAFIKNGILQGLKEKKGFTFVFCNHDGENDKEIDRLFLLFAKILSGLSCSLLIKVSSNNFEEVYYFQDNEELSGIPKKIPRVSLKRVYGFEEVKE